MDTTHQGGQVVPESVTQAIESYTPRGPASVYLGLAVGAIAVLLWSLMGVYMELTDYRASSPAERLRRGDFRPKRVG